MVTLRDRGKIKAPFRYTFGDMDLEPKATHGQSTIPCPSDPERRPSTHFYRYGIHSNLHGPISVRHGSQDVDVLVSDEYTLTDADWQHNNLAPFWNYKPELWPPTNDEASIEHLVTTTRRPRTKYRFDPRKGKFPDVPCFGKFAWSRITNVCESNFDLDVKCDHNLAEFKRGCANWQSRFELRRMGSRGHGVVSIYKEGWKQGDILGVYTGDLRPRLPLFQTNYVTEMRSGPNIVPQKKLKDADKEVPYMYIDSMFRGGWTRFINHECIPNAEFEEGRVGTTRCVIVRARRDIAEGEEITLCYSTDYFGGARGACLCKWCRGGVTRDGVRREEFRGKTFAQLSKALVLSEREEEGEEEEGEGSGEEDLWWRDWRRYFHQASVDLIRRASMYARQYARRRDENQELEDDWQAPFPDPSNTNEKEEDKGGDGESPAKPTGSNNHGDNDGFGRSSQEHSGIRRLGAKRKRSIDSSDALDDGVKSELFDGKRSSKRKRAHSNAVPEERKGAGCGG